MPIGSPGGTVTGSDYLYHHLKKLREERRLPMVVSMGSMAASGGIIWFIRRKRPQHVEKPEFSLREIEETTK